MYSEETISVENVLFIYRLPVRQRFTANYLTSGSPAIPSYAALAHLSMLLVILTRSHFFVLMLAPSLAVLWSL